MFELAVFSLLIGAFFQNEKIPLFLGRSPGGELLRFGPCLYFFFIGILLTTVIAIGFFCAFPAIKVELTWNVLKCSLPAVPWSTTRLWPVCPRVMFGPSRLSGSMRAKSVASALAFGLSLGSFLGLFFVAVLPVLLFFGCLRSLPLIALPSLISWL